MTNSRLYALVCLLLPPKMLAIEARIHPSPLPAFVPRMPQKGQRRMLGPPKVVSPSTQIHQVATLGKISMDSVTSSPASPQDLWVDDQMVRCRHLWGLTPEESTKLGKLHEKLSDIQDSTKNNPFEVVRFLRENKGNIDVAESKFRAMMKWRQEKQVDKMLDPSEYRPPSLYRYFPAGVLQGVDYDGDPIHVERTGDADSKGLLDRYGREEMLNHAIWIREIQSRGKWHHAYEQQQGHPVKEFTAILDMKGLKMKNMGPALISVSQEVSRLVQDYYPSYAKRIIVIRAPAIFQLAFNALKPFIDQSMREKITVSGGDYRKVLEKYMDLSVLPAEICPEGQGKAVEDFPNIVWGGGDIPDHEESVLFSLPSVEPTPVLESSMKEESAMGAISNPVETQETKIPTIAMHQPETLEDSIRRMPLKDGWLKRQLAQFQASFTDFDTPPPRGLSYSI